VRKCYRDLGCRFEERVTNDSIIVGELPQIVVDMECGEMWGWTSAVTITAIVNGTCNASTIMVPTCRPMNVFVK
jgi:hypothetical protein